jgi:hypothetical protein
VLFRSRLLTERGDPMAKNKNFQFVRKGVKGEGKRQFSYKDLDYIKENTQCILNISGYRD